MVPIKMDSDRLDRYFSRRFAGINDGGGIIVN
jgi:hypothetical protein